MRQKFLHPTILWLLILILFSSAPHTIHSQSPVDADLQASGEALFSKYLSDTLNANEKISELIKQAKVIRSGQQDALTALTFYQIALALEPYSKNAEKTLFRLHADFAGFLGTNGSMEFAMQNWKTALNIYRTYQPKATPESYNILGSMVGYYISSGQYDSAFYYYTIATHEAEQTGIQSLIASSNNNVGMLKTKTGDYIAAHQSYEKAIQLLKISNRADSALKVSILDNLAELSVLEKKWDDAEKYYAETSSLLSKLGGESPRLFRSKCGEIRVLIETKRLDEAMKKISELDNYFISIRSQLSENHLLTYYQLKFDFAIARGMLQEVGLYQYRISKLKDSLFLVNEKFTDPLARALINITMYKFDKDLDFYQLQLSENKRDLAEAKRKESRNLIATAGALLFSLLLFLFFRNRHRLQKNEIRLQQYKHQLAEQELYNKKLLQEKTEAELKHKKSDLHELGVYLNLLRNLHQSMSEKLDSLKQKKGEGVKTSIEKLLDDWDKELYAPQRLQMIQENIDLVNSEFYERLLSNFPELTKSEVELCGLLKLNLSSKEISALKGISQESVKMARYRLRKKLKLKPEEDIYKSLSRIVVLILLFVGLL